METDRLLGKKEEVQPPKDRLWMVYIIFYWLGVSTLLPWNFFSNAKMYYMYKLRNTTFDTNTTNTHYEPPSPEDETFLQTMFESLLTVCAMVPNVGFMYLNSTLTNIVSLSIRIITSICIMIGLFVFSIVLTQINTDSWQFTFLLVTLGTIMFMNAASAVFQGATFGLAGTMPKKYTQSVMAGMGMGGTLAAVANIICVSIGSNPWQTGFGYFLCATLCLVLGLIGYIILPYTRYYKFYKYDQEKSRTLSQSVNSSTDGDGASEGEGESARTTSYSSESGVETAMLPASPVAQQSTMCQVCQKIIMYGLCVFVTFFITLSCFPAINSAIKSTSTNVIWRDQYFMPVTCFLLFNFFDWIGRCLTSIGQWPKEQSKWIIVLCLSRVVFIPLFLMCNVQPRSQLPVWFEHDAFPIVFMIVFAMSNGYLGTICMMYGPSQAHPMDVERAASLMSFYLSLGLALGAGASIITVYYFMI